MHVIHARKSRGGEHTHSTRNVETLGATDPIRAHPIPSAAKAPSEVIREGQRRQVQRVDEAESENIRSGPEQNTRIRSFRK